MISRKQKNIIGAVGHNGALPLKLPVLYPWKVALSVPNCRHPGPQAQYGPLYGPGVPLWSNPEV